MSHIFKRLPLALENDCPIPRQDRSRVDEQDMVAVEKELDDKY